ncbi:unnamed protein product [Microthlaspi erraticum]|uniref:Reverse transcriptase domain-containing protein n=1 Tax=Microthlaspi erraticum TaxID=1685480 RepID=A0A6D2IIE0_9BRAS|nr:unnamed protein product [Microthlaspi erraticum]
MNRSFPGWRYDSNHSEEAENGRIVVIWNPILTVIPYYKTDQLILCGVFNPITSISITVGFVYAHNVSSERIPLWTTLRLLASNDLLRASPWILLGVFNQVLSSAEVYSFRPSLSPFQRLGDFRDCLFDIELYDLSSQGCHHTWTNKCSSNPKTRKLDRALINEAWQDAFPSSNAYFDVPGCFDHSPCLVTISAEVQRRISRFNFFTFFTFHPDYPRLISEAWNSLLRPSNPMFSLYQKLRAAKVCCKTLNNSRFNNIQARSREAFERLESLQRQVLSNQSPAIFEEERAARDSVLLFATAKESFFRLKSRVRWLSEGDANTGFFHKSVKANLTRNAIHFLKDNQGNRISETTALKNMVLGYYSELMGKANPDVRPPSFPTLSSILGFRCSEGLSRRLSTLPSLEEIKDAVFVLPKNKAPGPDGFTVEFFTLSWDLVRNDLISAVKDFFLNGTLTRQVNATVISLIPKILGASVLSDFRPISLCNTVYKVISRLLANRLKLITLDVVQRNQVGFVNSRLLCENVLLAPELVMDFNRPGPTSRGCVQIDITKAYDNVNWSFILNILEALGLPQNFISWIKICITSPYYYVALNGELVGFFPGRKGLRQGDLISSSLFVLAMDVLSKSLDSDADQGRFGVHPLCVNPLVTHLSFADYLLVFFDGKEESLKGIIEILKEFQDASGLALSLRKTSLFLDGDNNQLTQDLATKFGLQTGSLPVRYLGLPLMPRNLTWQDCQPLIDKVKSRISSWTVRPLSFAGRLQLIQSVLYGIVNY